MTSRKKDKFKIFTECIVPKTSSLITFNNNYITDVALRPDIEKNEYLLIKIIKANKSGVVRLKQQNVDNHLLAIFNDNSNDNLILIHYNNNMLANPKYDYLKEKFDNININNILDQLYSYSRNGKFRLVEFNEIKHHPRPNANDSFINEEITCKSLKQYLKDSWGVTGEGCNYSGKNRRKIF